MHVIVKGSIKLVIDNMSTMNLSKHPIAHGKGKHIETWFHFLRDEANIGRLKLVYCRTKGQITNILTKPLKKERFEKLRNKLGCGLYKI